jgi:glucosamine-6-phosphate deaminase
VEILVVAGPAEAAHRAADAVLEGLAAAHRAEPTLGLATGSSPLGLYAELACAVAGGRLDLSRAWGFALDEYVGLPQGHPQSYRQVLVREVCQRLGLPPDRLHVPDGSFADETALEASAAEYERLIRDAGGIDVQILGIGANGHLGFNEPGSSLTSRTRVKRLSERTRSDNARFFEAPAAVPTHCVTQGLGTVLDARRLVLVATGAAKAEAVAAAVEGPLTASCPASVIQWHSDATIVLDDAAAAGLRNREYYDASAAGLGGC